MYLYMYPSADLVQDRDYGLEGSLQLHRGGHLIAGPPTAPLSTGKLLVNASHVPLASLRSLQVHGLACFHIIQFA